MSDPIKFTFTEKKEILVDEDTRYRKLKRDKRLKDLGPIFDAIDEKGNEKGRVDGVDELKLLKLLSQKLGDNITPEKIKNLVQEFEESGKKIEVFLNPKPVEKELAVEETPQGTQPEGKVVVQDKGAVTPTTVVPESEEKKEEVKKEVLSDDGKSSQRAFNQAIQVAVTRRAAEKETLTKEFTQTRTIERGDSLYKIAVDALKAEGVENPGWKAINDRITEIALVNGLKDVNSVKIGTELKVGKTPGAPAPTQVPGAPVPGAQEEEGEEDKKGVVPTSTPISVGESSIKVKEDFDTEGWTVTDVEGENGIKKYTKTEGEGESAITKEMYSAESNGVVLTSETLEGLKEIKEAYENNQPAAAPADESEDAAAARKTENLNKLKTQIALYPTKDVLVKVAEQLKDETLVDRNSEEVKALVNDMLKTLEPAVVKAIVLDESGDFDKTVFEKDLTSFETMRGMFKAIRDKEFRGEKLSDTEHALKSTLKEVIGIGGFKIEADTEKGIVEKYLAIDSDGNIQYNSPTGVRAATPEMLDECVTKLNAADTPEKKAALFKEYASTTDKVLAANLAANTETWNASKEDIETLINNSDMKTLSSLNVKDEYKADLYKKAAEKAKELFLSDKGNLDNARYLKEIFGRINESGLTDEEKNAIKTEILESYFTVTTAEDGTKTYTFEPSRRPTYEEMHELAKNTNTGKMDAALVKSIKLEDMGEKEYSAAIEKWVPTRIVVQHYEPFIDGMSEEEVIDFIKNKVSYHSDIPNDKILEKFPDNQEIRELLTRCYEDNKGAKFDSIISDENRLSLIKDYITVNEDGSWSFDKTKLPDGIDAQQIVKLLPENCTEGDAAKAAKAIFMQLDLSNEDLILFLNNKSFNMDADYGAHILKFIESDAVKNGTQPGNEFIDWCIEHADAIPNTQREILYANATMSKKEDMISKKFVSDSHVLVQKGDTVDKIIINYLTNNLDKFPQLKESVNNNPNKWTPERIREALNDYMKDFREDIMADLGIKDPTKLQPGQLLELDNVNWEEHQPGWLNYNLTY